jgi:soluble lytic murein transglycosylase
MMRVILLLVWVLAAVGDDTVISIRSYNQTIKNQTEENYKKLQIETDGQKDSAVRARDAFGMGIIAYKKKDFQKAANYLGESINLKTHLDDFAHFYIGLIERDNKDLNGARLHFNSVRTHQPPSSREAEAEIELAQIAKIQNHWAEAFALLVHLERKHRYDPQYQEILYNLIEASFENHHNFEACKAAVKLYSKFSPYSLSKGWGFDLSKSHVGNHQLKCPVTVKDQDTRLEKLLVGGEFEEVRAELKEFPGLSDAELERGQLALAEGKAKEAIAHFLTAQSQENLKNNITVQLLLSKAYAQNDDYPTAVESYLKASTMGPRFGRKATLAQKALFQAAFLSYQYRNYDGASRLFEQIADQGRGQFVWDAKWQLAWIRYLKGDYEGAKKEFIILSQNKHYSAVDLEKLTYWRAMSELRDGNQSEARNLFLQLAGHARMGYYTGAAIARLSSLDGKAALPSSQVKSASAKIVSARKPASEEGISSEKEIEKIDDTPSAEEEEGEEGVANGDFELGPPVTSLKNSALLERFDRAKDFIDLGYDAWAITELREIEKRTTNRDYLENLMAEYSKAGEFFRSATIADSVFETERVQGGIEGANALWKFAFPQAFAKYVNSSSKKFDVPTALIWAVMRGESGFREDIHSTAGAMGLMQLIPPTAKRVAKSAGINDFTNQMLLSADTNVTLGTRYLKRLDKVMDRNLSLIIASYNAGPHKVQGWLKDFGDLEQDEFVEHIPYLETRNYVKKVMRNYMIYQTLYDKKTNPLKSLAEKPSIKFGGIKPTSESWDEIKE